MTPNPVIRFFSEDVPFRLKGKTKIRQWIHEVILHEKKNAGIINFIFCTDDYLLQLNETFLKHDNYTDILTFPDTEDPAVIAGDIFISIPRVTDNAATFEQAFEQELYRVMVHGVLHLIGYKDKTKAERIRMTAKEDEFLVMHDI